MMNVIKTAIVTIIISIISGLLLEYFKNVAPRIVCSISDALPTQVRGEKVFAYNIEVKNTSNKILHELTLNIQGYDINMGMGKAHITKGLKFDSAMKNDILEIDIPFLSKGDKFKVTVYLKNRKKPEIVMRSPEKFKEIFTEEKTRFGSKNTQGDSKDKAISINQISKNKKIIIAAASIVVVILAISLVQLFATGSGTQTSTNSATNTVSNSTNEAATDSVQNSSNSSASGQGTYNSGSKGGSYNTPNTNSNSKVNTSSGGTSKTSTYNSSTPTDAGSGSSKQTTTEQQTGTGTNANTATTGNTSSSTSTSTNDTTSTNTTSNTNQNVTTTNGVTSK